MRVLYAVLAGLVFAMSAAQAGPYPDHPITFLAPFGAGGDSDVFARLLAAHASKYLGGQVIRVENRTGRSGVVASVATKNAPADGYTLLLARVGSHAIQPALDPKTPYRPEDFSVLEILDVSPLVCAVRADSPIKSIHELQMAIRKAPGQLKYSTAGPGTIQNLAVRYLLSLSGLKFGDAVAVHFESGGEATQALIRGRVQFACNNAPTMVKPIQSGVLRGLMTTAQGRMTELPDLMNATEVGLRDLGRLQGWTALVGPRNLSVEIRTQWTAVFLQIAQDPRWQKDVTQLGGTSAIRSIENPTQFVHRQAAMYEQLVTILEIRP